MMYVLKFHCVDSAYQETFRYNEAPLVPKIGEDVDVIDSNGRQSARVVRSVTYVYEKDTIGVLIIMRRPQ